MDAEMKEGGPGQGIALENTLGQLSDAHESKPSPGERQPTPGLRPYQRTLGNQFWVAKEAAHRSILAVLPTGGGKTCVAADIIAEAVRRGGRVLFVAHRRELTRQAADKLRDVGIEPGIIQAGFEPQPERAVQVASIATLYI